MIAVEDRRSRIAGARVAGRVFAVPFDGAPSAVTTPACAEALFALLNQPDTKSNSWRRWMRWACCDR